MCLAEVRGLLSPKRKDKHLLLLALESDMRDSLLIKKIMVEGLGWLITLVILALVLLPIYTQIGSAYLFYFDNTMFVLIGVTFLRYMFLLSYHWLSSSKWLKALFIFVPIPIFFYLLGALYEFQAYSDEVGLGEMLSTLSHESEVSLRKYIKSEMLLFWAMAFLSNLYMPIRMILSLWREVNKGYH